MTLFLQHDEIIYFSQNLTRLNFQLSKWKSFSKIPENPAYLGSLKAVCLTLPNLKDPNTIHRTLNETCTEIPVLKPLEVISYVFGKLTAICPHKPRSLSSIKVNTPLPNSSQNTRKSKSLQLNFTWTIWEKKPTSVNQLFTPWEPVKESNSSIPATSRCCTYITSVRL